MGFVRFIACWTASVYFSARSLIDDGAVVEPNLLVVGPLVAQLRVLIATVHAFDARIAQLCEQLADYKIFAGLPGAGPAFAPRLLAAFGETRERFTCSARCW